MDIFCPNCLNKIEADSINVQTDLAKCNNCGSVYKLSEIVDLSKYQNEKESLELPAGSKITNKIEESSVQFFFPPVGMKAKVIPFFVFSIVWLTFITFWTVMAAQASFAFAAFSIPFWLVGLGMLLISIITAKERQEICINKEFFTIRKIRPIKSGLKQIPLSDINNIALENYVLKTALSVRPMNRSYKSNNYIPSLVPVVTYGTNKESFFDNASEAERKWIVVVVNRIIQKLKKDGYLVDISTLK